MRYKFNVHLTDGKVYEIWAEAYRITLLQHLIFYDAPDKIIARFSRGQWKNILKLN